MKYDFDKLIRYTEKWWENIVLEDGTSVLDSVHPLHFADFAYDILSERGKFSKDDL